MRRCLALFALWTILPGLPAQNQPAQSARDLTGLLPADTPVVFDLHDGAACAQKLLDLMTPLPKGVPPEVRVGLLALPVVTKAKTGMDVKDLLEVLAPGQAAFAMFPAGARPFPVFLSRVEEPAEVRRVLARIVDGKSVHASLDDAILTITNRAAHLKQVLRFRASGAPTLLAHEGYRKGRAALESGTSIRFYLDVRTIRQGYGKSATYWGGLDDGARLLFGPIARTLDLCQRLDGRLDLSGQGLRLHGRADADLRKDAKQAGRLRASGSAERVIPPRPRGTLACLSLDRDLRAYLADPEAWLRDDGATQVKSFLSTADNLLGGASLVDKVLPNVAMPPTLFVTDSTPDEYADEPRMKLPAFSFVFELDEAADGKLEKYLTRATNIITTIANVTRAQQKKTSISVRRERHAGYKLMRVQFAEWNGPGEPPTEQGLSPALLFAHGHGILSSTIDGAVRVAEALKTLQPLRVVGDFLSLHGDAIAKLVRDNRSLLAVGRILDEGETRKEAERFVDALAAIVKILSFEARIEPRTGSTGFSFSLRRQR